MLHVVYRTITATTDSNTDYGRSGRYELGWLTYDDETKVVCRYTPHGYLIDRCDRNTWENAQLFLGWRVQYQDLWTLDPEKSYYSDSLMDEGL